MGAREYSDDRKSLGQEIRATLRTYGATWVPETDGPDLITALARHLATHAEQAAEVARLKGELEAANNARIEQAFVAGNLVDELREQRDGLARALATLVAMYVRPSFIACITPPARGPDATPADRAKAKKSECWAAWDAAQKAIANISHQPASPPLDSVERELGHEVGADALDPVHDQKAEVPPHDVLAQLYGCAGVREGGG